MLKSPENGGCGHEFAKVPVLGATLFLGLAGSCGGTRVRHFHFPSLNSHTRTIQQINKSRPEAKQPGAKGGQQNNNTAPTHFLGPSSSHQTLFADAPDTGADTLTHRSAFEVVPVWESLELGKPGLDVHSCCARLDRTLTSGAVQKRGASFILLLIPPVLSSKSPRITRQ